MFERSLDWTNPKPVIELQYFHRLREGKRFRAGCYVFRVEGQAIVDDINKEVKKEMPGSTPPFVGASGPMSPQSCAALARVVSGILRKMILPEITCFRKVAL